MPKRRDQTILPMGAMADNAKNLQDQIKRQETRDESSRIFKKMDADGSNTASREEIYKFVAKNDELWEKLRKRLNQPKDKARQAATRVAMELATGLTGEAALHGEVTKDQFHDFRKRYILDPDGAEEFFHRAIFANFDADHSGELDQEELDQFLDAIYDTRDVRKGRVSLLSKGQMKDLIIEKFDVDGDMNLSFNEVKDIIGGGATALNKLKREKEKEELDIQSPGSSKTPSPKGGTPSRKGSSRSRSPSRSTSGGAKIKVEKSQPAGSATSENWREKAEVHVREVPVVKAEEEEESDFCDWLERKLTGAPKGGEKKGLCRNCVIM